MGFKDVRAEKGSSQGQNLALTGVLVASLLGGGYRGAREGQQVTSPSSGRRCMLNLTLAASLSSEEGTT